MRIAEKPACAPPAQIKKKDETPPTSIPPEEQLTVPKKISELKGCWESVRGDLDIVSDDEERRLIGKVRQCYCFGGRGAGEFKLNYSDGVKCRAPITAELEGDTLKIHQPGFRCVWKGQHRGLVPTEIVCRSAENEATPCEYQALGRLRTKGVEQYRRVPLGHCN